MIGISLGSLYDLISIIKVASTPDYNQAASFVTSVF